MAGDQLKIARVYVEVAPTLSGFFSQINRQLQSGMGGAGRTAGGLLGQSLQLGASNALRKLGGLAKVVTGTGLAAAGALAGATIAGGLNRALNIEDAKSKLDGLGYSAKSVEGITKDVLASVKGTAFGMDQMLGVGASSLAAGIKEGEDLTRFLKSVGDTATISGASVAEIGAVFNKIQSGGKATTISLLQLSNRGLPVMQWLQKDLGKTADEMQSMVSKGEVTSEMFRAAIEKNIGGAALKSGETARGAFANTRAAFSRLGAAVVGGSIPVATTMMNSLMPTVDKLTEKLTPLANAFWETFGPKMTAAVDSGLQALLRLIDGTYVLPEALQWILPYAQNILNLFKTISGAWIKIISAFTVNVDFGSILGQVSQIITNLLPIISQLVSTLLPVLPLLVQIAEVMLSMMLPVMVAFSEVLSYLQPTLVPIIIGVGSLILAGKGFLAVWGLAKGIVLGTVGAFQAMSLALTRLIWGELRLRVVMGMRIATMRAGLTAWAAQKSAMLAQNVVAIATALRIKAVAAAQWLWNAAMTANPIGLIIAGVAGLIAGIVFLATKTQFFQTIWKGVVAGFKWGINIMLKGITFVIDAVKWVINAFQWLGKQIGKVFGGISKFFGGGGAELIVNAGGKAAGAAAMQVPFLAKGATVTGPTLAMIGEGGKPETVVDTGLTNRLIANANKQAEATRNANPTNAGGPVVINVNATPETNISELARQLEKEIYRQRRR